jgi:hypothetical protein
VAVSHRASAVLFVLIGWSDEYRGGPVTGGHAYLQEGPDYQTNSGEANLFERRDNGFFACGVGRHEIHARQGDLDIVFVAREEGSGLYRAVAAFFGAAWEHTPDDYSPDWRTAHTRDSLLLPKRQRPEVPWPKGQGMRRWAKSGPTRTWERLYPTYDLLCKMVGI